MFSDGGQPYPTCPEFFGLPAITGLVIHGPDQGIRRGAPCPGRLLARRSLAYYFLI